MWLQNKNDDDDDDDDDWTIFAKVELPQWFFFHLIVRQWNASFSLTSIFIGLGSSQSVDRRLTMTGSDSESDETRPLIEHSQLVAERSWVIGQNGEGFNKQSKIWWN